MSGKFRLIALMIGIPAVLSALGLHLDLAAQKRAVQFCNALPLDTEVDASMFAALALLHQPSGISGSTGENGPYFGGLGARFQPITPKDIETSGMDGFLRNLGAPDENAIISATFYGRLPYSVYVCEIKLKGRRFAAKQVIDGDNSDTAGQPFVIKAYPRADSAK